MTKVIVTVPFYAIQKEERVLRFEETMKQNMGTIDRVIRIAAAAVVALLYGTGAISGTVGIILAVFAVVLLATSFIGFCPLYLPFGWSTRPKA